MTVPVGRSRPESNLQDEIRVHKAEKAHAVPSCVGMCTGGASSDWPAFSAARCNTSVAHADKELEECAEALRKVAVEEGYIQ